MRPEQRRVRQMSVVLRLRTLQCEESERILAGKLRVLQQSQAALRAEQHDYEQLLERYRQQQGPGVTLNPTLHAERLQNLLAVRTVVLDKEAQVAEAQRHLLDAKAALIEKRAAERVAQMAFENAKLTQARHFHELELIDIFDAQQAGGGQRGF